MRAHSLSPTAALLSTLLLAGCTDEGPEHDAAGASGGKGGSSTGAAGASGGSAGPTWHQDIAPLVTEACVSCHREGGIGLFSLETYAEAAKVSGYLAGNTRARAMPPFLAATTAECEPRFGFKDDPRLSQAEIDLFGAWHNAKAPEGDPNTAAPLPAPTNLELTDAEVTVTIPTPVTIEGPGDKLLCFSLAPDLTPLAASGPIAAILGDRVLVDALQVTPGNSAIVHHVLVYTDAAGESAALAAGKGYYDCFGGPNVSGSTLVMAWAPGATPLRAPERVALSLPSTGRLVMQVHYHPTSVPETDSATSLQLRGYGNAVPEYVGTIALVGNDRATDADGLGLQPGPNDGAMVEFKIPAGAQAHTETMLYGVPGNSPDLRIWTVGSHMHFVGTDMRISIARQNAGSEPGEECLLQTPNWNFDWQRGYVYDVPIEQAPSAKAGDIVKLRCTYDNSESNYHVSEALAEQGLTAPQDVHLGEESLDEMCLGVFGTAVKLSDLLP